jgi:hypothetical protein
MHSLVKGGAVTFHGELLPGVGQVLLEALDPVAHRHELADDLTSDGRGLKLQLLDLRRDCGDDDLTSAVFGTFGLHEGEDVLEDSLLLADVRELVERVADVEVLGGGILVLRG